VHRSFAAESTVSVITQISLLLYILLYHGEQLEKNCYPRYTTSLSDIVVNKPVYLDTRGKEKMKLKYFLKTREVKRQYEKFLLLKNGVIGCGVGLDNNDKLGIAIYISKDYHNIPSKLDGVYVFTEEVQSDDKWAEQGHISAAPIYDIKIDQHLPLGEGNIGFTEILRRLKEYGYDGPLIIEAHSINDLIADLNHLRNMLSTI
jgi:hypothetical protein